MTAINWFTPLYLLAIYGLVRYFAKPKEGEEKGAVNWTPLESAGITLAIYFAAQIVGGLLVYAIPMLRGWNDAHISAWIDKSVGAQFILITAVEAITLVLLYFFLKRRRATPSTIGFGRRPKWSDLSYVFAGFAAYFILYIILTSVVTRFVPHLNVNQQQQIGFEGAKHLQLVLVFMSLVIFPPFVEETLVRGFLYTGLKKGIPMLWAVVITSSLFAIAHLQAGDGQPLLWTAALDTFTLSLVLIYLREKTGSLWASIGLHMLKNLVAFLSLFVFHII